MLLTTVPAQRRGHHIGLLALLRSSRAHKSLLSICRARPRTGCAGDAAGRCDGDRMTESPGVMNVQAADRPVTVRRGTCQATYGMQPEKRGR